MASLLPHAWRAVMARHLYLLIPLSVLVTDWLVMWQGPPARLLTHPAHYLMSLMCSVCLWWSLFTLLSAYRAVRLVMVGLMPLFGLALGSAWQFTSLTSFPTVTVLLYILQEPSHAWGMAASQLVALRPWLGLVWGLGVSVLVWRAPQRVQARSTRLIAMLVFTLTVGFVGVLPEAQPFRFSPYTSDVRLMNLVGQASERLLTQKTAFALVTRRDAPLLPEQPLPPAHDVLIILTESLRPDHLTGQPGSAHDTSPQLARLIKERGDESHLYPHAFSNASYTAFSMVSAWTGLSISTTERLATTPLLWHYAQALGVHAFYTSSQDIEWAHMRDFLFTAQPPDLLFSPLYSDAPAQSEVSIDDRAAARQLAHAIELLPRSERFFGIFQTYATHFPFFADEQAPWPVTDTASRYDAAVHLTDESIGIVVEALRKTGRLEHTLLIVTSDHAEYIYREEQEDHSAHRQGRLRTTSCHPTITHIPFVMLVPDALAGRPVAPTQRIVSLLDIAPTVLDSWGVSRDHMDGESLLTPGVRRARQAMCASSAEPYPGALLGFAIYTPEGIFYNRYDFPQLDYFALDDPGAYTQWEPGREPSAAERAQYKRYLVQEPPLRALDAHVEARR